MAIHNSIDPENLNNSIIACFDVSRSRLEENITNIAFVFIFIDHLFFGFLGDKFCFYFY